MPLSWMHRLAPLLAPAESDADKGGAGPGQADDARADAAWPDATFCALFGYDEQGTVTVALEVEAELPLICQRSMQPFSERVRRHSMLSVVDSVAAQEGLPEHYEPVLVDHGRIALVEMVEDELLLAVPQVPRNPEVGEVLLSTDGSSDAVNPQKEEDLQRPFEGLAELLGKSARRN